MVHCQGLLILLLVFKGVRFQVSGSDLIALTIRLQKAVASSLIKLILWQSSFSVPIGDV